MSSQPFICILLPPLSNSPDAVLRSALRFNAEDNFKHMVVYFIKKLNDS